MKSWDECGSEISYNPAIQTAWGFSLQNDALQGMPQLSTAAKPTMKANVTQHNTSFERRDNIFRFNMTEI